MFGILKLEVVQLDTLVSQFPSFRVNIYKITAEIISGIFMFETGAKTPIAAKFRGISSTIMTNGVRAEIGDSKYLASKELWQTWFCSAHSDFNGQ